MPYVGNPLADAFSSREKQDLTGQSGTSFTLSHAVSHANDLSVYINHVRQEPTTAYSVNGTTLTTTGSVAATDDFYIIYDELAVQSISHPTDQALTATSGTFTSGLVGTTATFSGAVSGTTGTFSGATTGAGFIPTEIALPSAGTPMIYRRNTDDYLYIQSADEGGSDKGIYLLDGGQNTMATFNPSSIALATNNSTKMTINTDGNVGIGQAPESGHHANWTAVDIGNRGGIANYKTTGDITLNYNLYHDGAWKAKETAPSGRYAIGAGPYHIWYNGASASADGAVTLTEIMRINNNGALGIGDDDPQDKLHVKGGQAQIESLAGDGAYLRINNTANSGGKIWRAGDGVLSHGTFSIYDQTDNTFPFNVSMDGVVGSTVTLGVARYRNHASISLGYGSNVHLTVGQGLVNVSNRSYGYGALFMVSYASQVAEVSDPSNQFDIGSGGNILGAGVYKNNNNYTVHVINKDTNGGTRGFSIQVISNDY